MKLFIAAILIALQVIVCPAKAGDQKRADGISLHMLPDRVAKLSNSSGGFTIAAPATKETGTTIIDLTLLAKWVEKTPQNARDNGIWIVYTNPASYTKEEMARLDKFAEMMKKKNVKVFVCRGSDLPDGWVEK